MPEQEFFEETEEPEGALDNPDGQGQVVALLKALQEEVRTLAVNITKPSEARENPPEVTNSPAPTVEKLLESEALKSLLRAGKLETLERVIAQVPRLDEGVRKALLSALAREGEEGEDSDAPTSSDGARCLELRERIRVFREEVEGLDGDRSAFTEEGVEKRTEDRKVTVLLDAEREKAEQELSEILAAVEDPEPSETVDRWGQ